MYGAHDVRVETVPDAKIVEPTDASGSGDPCVHLRQRSLAIQLDGAKRDRKSHGP